MCPRSPPARRPPGAPGAPRNPRGARGFVQRSAGGAVLRALGRADPRRSAAQPSRKSHRGKRAATRRQPGGQGRHKVHRVRHAQRSERERLRGKPVPRCWAIPKSIAFTVRDDYTAVGRWDDWENIIFCHKFAIGSGSRTSSCLNDLFVLCNRSEVTHKSSEFVPKKYGTAFASTRDPAERPGLAKFGMQNAHKLPRRRRIRRVAIRPFRRGQIRACRRGRCAVLRGAAGRRQGRVLYQRLETV